MKHLFLLWIVVLLLPNFGAAQHDKLIKVLNEAKQNYKVGKYYECLLKVQELKKLNTPLSDKEGDTPQELARLCVAHLAQDKAVASLETKKISAMIHRMYSMQAMQGKAKPEGPLYSQRGDEKAQLSTGFQVFSEEKFFNNTESRISAYRSAGRELKEPIELYLNNQYLDAYNKLESIIFDPKNSGRKVLLDNALSLQGEIIEDFSKLDLLMEEQKKLKELVKVNAEFYKDEIALVWEGNYRFVDKSGKAIADLGEWEDANMFDGYGLAKVGNKGQYFLMDEKGDRLTAVFSLKELSKMTNTAPFALMISDTSFNSFPRVVLQYPALECLVLNGTVENKNNFSVPANMEKLKSLRILALSHCLITKVSSEIGELTDLEVLDLSFNRMSALPSQLSHLVQLRTLNLGRNYFTQVPAAISDMQNLTELDLSYNQLTSFPEELVGLRQLKRLVLTGNKKMSRNTVKELREQMPDCEIIF